MIADKVSQEACRFFRAYVLRNQMNAVGSLVEAVSHLVDRHRTAFDLHPHSAFENIANHRTGVAVRRRRTARRIGHLDRRHLQLASIQLRDVITGLIKSVAFATIIAHVGCLEGFRVRGGPDSVGRSTTNAVVKSTFLVIVADAVFTAIFYLTVKS